MPAVTTSAGMPSASRLTATATVADPRPESTSEWINGSDGGFDAMRGVSSDEGVDASGAGVVAARLAANAASGTNGATLQRNAS